MSEEVDRPLPAPLNDAELRAYQNESLLLDDEYTTELRLQVVYYGESLLNRVKYEVELLEKELVALSTVFNEFLDEVKIMDDKIGGLSTAINKGKMQAARELDATIKQEVQMVVEQLRLLPKADLDGVEVLYQNLDALQDNYQLLQAQIETLEEIGVKTEPLEKHLPALEKGLTQFGKSIEERQMNLLVGETPQEEKIDYDALKHEINALIQTQRRAMINHLRQAQTMANPQEVALLRRNQAGFEKSHKKILTELEKLREAQIDIQELEENLKPLTSGISQFERALSSNQFLKFSERIFEEIQVINEQIREAQNCNNPDDIEILQENIEVLFENCDTFADEIETMESQGLPIDKVVEHYEVLRVTVEQFERVVQDSANRIGLTSGSLRS